MGSSRARGEYCEDVGGLVFRRWLTRPGFAMEESSSSMGRTTSRRDEGFDDEDVKGRRLTSK